MVSRTVFLALVFASAGLAGEQTPPAPTRTGEPTYEGTTLDAWIQRAKSSESADQIEAMDALRHFHAAAVPILTAWLTDPDAFIRSWAIESIEHIGPGAKSAVPVLLNLLRDGERDDATEISDALGSIGPDAKIAIPALVELLGSDETRWSAVRALGNMGAPAIPSLILLLKNSDADIRAAAAEALGHMGSTAVTSVPAITELLSHGEN